jgi:hypothetical protein
MTSISDLYTAQSENMHNQPEGADSETNSDLGYMSPEQFYEFMREHRESLQEDNRSNDIGRVTCGDCFQIMPCPHGDGRQTFGN